jgi:hypothetical protein
MDARSVWGSSPCPWELSSLFQPSSLSIDESIPVPIDPSIQVFRSMNPSLSIDESILGPDRSIDPSLSIDESILQPID